MKIGSKGVEVPDDCGDFCPIMVSEGRKYPLSFQGDECSRCPIFCCAGDDPMFQPEHFNDRLTYYYLTMWGMV